jgi:hypothetical protein
MHCVTLQVDWLTTKRKGYRLAAYRRLAVAGGMAAQWVFLIVGNAKEYAYRGGIGSTRWKAHEKDTLFHEPAGYKPVLFWSVSMMKRIGSPLFAYGTLYQTPQVDFRSRRGSPKPEHWIVHRDILRHSQPTGIYTKQTEHANVFRN